MKRVHQGLSADLEWISVSAMHRCPVCGGSDGCKTHTEGPFAACGHQPSDWPMTSGAWLHRVRAHAALAAVRTRVDAPGLAIPTVGSAS